MQLLDSRGLKVVLAMLQPVSNSPQWRLAALTQLATVVYFNSQQAQQIITCCFAYTAELVVSFHMLLNLICMYKILGMLANFSNAVELAGRSPLNITTSSSNGCLVCEANDLVPNGLILCNW